jgi:cation transport ATPase
VFECDQVKIKTLYTYCEQVGRRAKDCGTKRKEKKRKEKKRKGKKRKEKKRKEKERKGKKRKEKKRKKKRKEKKRKEKKRLLYKISAAVYGLRESAAHFLQLQHWRLVLIALCIYLNSINLIHGTITNK